MTELIGRTSKRIGLTGLMIPDLVHHLYEQTYAFVWAHAVTDLTWADLTTSVAARYEAYANTRAAYANVLPILTTLAVKGDAETAVPLAAAWALYDLASDVFDDIQDQDGKDWPWSQWSPSRAMNVGLGLVAAANGCLANLSIDKDVQSDIWFSWSRTFALAARSQATPVGIPSLTQYFSQVAAKSGLIYANVAYAGARLHAMDRDLLRQLYNYGLALGTLIQLKDDCRDLSVAHPGSDLAGGVYTLPVLYALSQTAHPAYLELTTMLPAATGMTATAAATIYQLVTEMGGLHYTMAMAKGYEQKALSALSVFPVEDVHHLSAYVSGFLV